MKMYARTKALPHLPNFKGENWQEVAETKHHYPSGLRSCVVFPSGKIYKIEQCEIVYVF